MYALTWPRNFASMTRTRANGALAQPGRRIGIGPADVRLVKGGAERVGHRPCIALVTISSMPVVGAPRIAI